jgi:hypothetical protein
MCPDFPSVSGVSGWAGVYVSSRLRLSGTATISALNTETTVIEVANQTNDFDVEGYIDVSAMQSGDVLVITEYVSVDGVNYNIYATQTLSNAQSQPVFRFTRKSFTGTMKYKVTVKQIGGTARSFPYSFIVDIYSQA